MLKKFLSQVQLKEISSVEQFYKDHNTSFDDLILIEELEPKLRKHLRLLEDSGMCKKESVPVMMTLQTFVW